MPTITKEKALKNQSMAPAGWVYDWKHYVLWGDNQLYHNVKQPDGSVIQATVCWHQRAGKYVPKLRVDRYTKSTGEMWVGYGLGKGAVLSADEVARRNYKDLCKWAGGVSDDMIMDVWTGANELQVAL